VATNRHRECHGASTLGVAGIAADTTSAIPALSASMGWTVHSPAWGILAPIRMSASCLLASSPFAPWTVTSGPRYRFPDGESPALTWCLWSLVTLIRRVEAPWQGKILPEPLQAFVGAEQRTEHR
jgi:hypothetical protein